MASDDRVFFTSVLVTAGFAACLVGCSGGHPEPKGKMPTVAVAKAQREPIAEIVSGEAELFAYRQASLSPKIASPIYRYNVNRGQQVHKGQLLAVLENRDLAAAVKDAEGGLYQAQANYATTSAATIPQQLQKAETDLANAKTNLEAEQKLYDNRVVLYKQGAIAGKDLDQSAVTFTAAKTQYENALKQLTDLKATVAGATKQSAAGQLESAQAKKQAADVQLHYSELRSPMDGVVAYRNLYPGDIAPAGTALITVMDVSKVIAKLHLPQAKAARLKIGDPASLKVEGVDHPLPGRVSVLSPALDPNSTTSEVWVEAPNPTGQLEPGSSVEVNIVARTVPDALVVPASAVINQDNGSTTVVTLKPDGTVVSQQVQVGIQQGDKTQIVGGVSAGQMVVSSGGYGLPDGTKVQPSLSTSQPTQSASKQPSP
ncbi:MAG: efflux RND transporter periplasmic adaptor subunit [Terriglobales bacterium]